MGINTLENSLFGIRIAELHGWLHHMGTLWPMRITCTLFTDKA